MRITGFQFAETEARARYEKICSETSLLLSERDLLKQEIQERQQVLSNLQKSIE